jgi:hypothetical protein
MNTITQITIVNATSIVVTLSDGTELPLNVGDTYTAPEVAAIVTEAEASVASPEPITETATDATPVEPTV